MRLEQKLLNFFSGYPLITFQKGEIIIRPDKPPAGIFYLHKGFVRVYSLTQEGDEKLHIIYKEGEVFPLMWAFHNVQKSIWYEAVGKTELYKIPKEKFLSLVSSDITVASELIDLLLSMFEVFTDRVETLEFSKAYPRLVSRLIFLAKRFGVRKGNEIILKAPITHRDIANSIAMSRETASREIELLEKKGIIEYQEHLIVIKDIRKLINELSAHYERKPL